MLQLCYEELGWAELQGKVRCWSWQGPTKEARCKLELTKFEWEAKCTEVGIGGRSKKMAFEKPASIIPL